MSLADPFIFGQWLGIFTTIDGDLVDGKMSIKLYQQILNVQCSPLQPGQMISTYQKISNDSNVVPRFF
jgi:hypothetical protein